MADGTTGNTVGELNVSIGANTAPLKAGLAAAETEVVAAGAGIEAAVAGSAASGVAGKNLNQQAKELAKNIKANIGGFTTLTKVVSGGLHLLGKWIGLVGLIGAGVWGIVKAWDAVVASATSAADKAIEHQKVVQSLAEYLTKLRTEGKDAPLDKSVLDRDAKRVEHAKQLADLDSEAEAVKRRIAKLDERIANSAVETLTLAGSDEPLAELSRQNDERIDGLRKARDIEVQTLEGYKNLRKFADLEFADAAVRIENEITDKRIENERKVADERQRLYQQFLRDTTQGTFATSGPNDALRLLSSIARNTRRGAYISEGGSSYEADR